MEKNYLLDPAYVRLAQTNIELRDELNREVDINRMNERKIRQLIRDLEKCEGELIRRSTTILDHEDEIQTLKNQILNLRKQLRSALKDINSNETIIDSKNNQIAGYEEDILRLKARIKELISHKKISSNQIEMANPTSPRMGDTTFSSVSQSIRNKLGRNHAVERALDELTEFYNQSQAELAMERDNTRIAIDDAMSWQNATAYILNDVEKTHKGEKLMHSFWRVYYEINTARLLSEIFALKILCKGYKNKAQPRAILYGKYNKWKNRTRAKHAKYNKWKLRTRLVRDANLELEDRINFLNQRILDLQNNIQNQNMATIQDVMAVVTPLIAPIPQYIGQEPPEDYVNKIIQLYNCAGTLGIVGAFNDAVKTQILASKMGGKYIPPNPFNNRAGILVNTPALFLAWLNGEYQRHNIGTQQIATQRLTQEKFTPYDTPESYETRIKPLLLGVANNDAYVLGVLKNQLPTELFNRMLINTPATIPEFFTRLKNMWLERKPDTFTYGGGSIYTNGITVPQPVFQPPPISQAIVPSQPVFQPQQINPIQNPPPLPPGYEYRLDEFHTNNFIDGLARKAGYTVTHTPLSILPPGGKKIRPKSDKAKAYEEMIEYARLGIDIEDDRPDDPMEIDLALVNLARRIGGNVSTPTTTTNVVNATRTVRKKKAPVKKRVIKKVVRPRKRRVNLVTYEEPTEEENPDNDEEEVIEELVYVDDDDDEENVEYVEVEDNSSVAMNLVKKK